MTEHSYPYGSSKILTEDDFSRMMRWAAADGVCGSSSDSALKPVADGSGAVVVPPGEAIVRGQKYLNDANKPLTIPNNATGATRWDLIVLRNDPSNDRITAEYKAGASTFPALVQDWNSVWEIPLGAGPVVSGTNTMLAEAMVDARWFTGWPVAPAPAARDWWPTPYKDRLLVQNGGLWVGTGAAWVQFDPWGDTGWIGLEPDWKTYWQQTDTCATRRHGGKVYLNVQVKRIGGLSRTDQDGSRLVTLPIGMRPTHHWEYFTATFSGGITIQIQIRGDGQVWALNPAANVPGGSNLRFSCDFLT